mgnify:CR=1 FL=1
MSEAFVFDAVRTPRGKGKKDGSLHEVKPIDLLTVASELERRNQLEEVGGFAALGQMAKDTPSAANITAYAEIMRERAIALEVSMATRVSPRTAGRRIDSARLWDSIMAMAKIGPGVAGGNNRQTLTDADGEGRHLFRR